MLWVRFTLLNAYLIKRTVKHRTCKLFFHFIQNKRVLFPTRSTVVWFTFGFKGGYHCDVKHQLPFALFMKEDKTTSIILLSNCFKKKRSFHHMFLCLKHFFIKYDMLFLYFFMKKRIKRLSMIFFYLDLWPLCHFDCLRSTFYF